MTHPIGHTAHASGTLIHDDDDDSQAAPRARAELMALLSGAALQPRQRSHPAPSFLPERRRENRKPATARSDERAGHQSPAWLQGAVSGHPDPYRHPGAAARTARRPAAAAPPRRKTRARHTRVWLALAAAVAIGIAGGHGLYQLAGHGIAVPGARPLARLADSLAALLPTAAAGDKLDVATAPPAGRKPVRTAHLAVADAAGKAMDRIPLQIALSGAEGGSDMVLRLAGLPQTAALSAGTRQADETWRIAASDLADLRLMLPAVPAQPLVLEVAALDGNTGELAAPPQEMTVKVASAAPAAPARGKADAAPLDATAMLAGGLERLLAGDVTAARALFRQALALGEKRAVAHLGRTYDPLVLARLAVTDAAPDREQAIAWYRRAIEAGDDTAHAALAALQGQAKR